VRFNASIVLMSGFGAPVRIASATGVPATFVMLPNANFCENERNAPQIEQERHPCEAAREGNVTQALNTADYARSYIKRRWAVVPIPSRQKGPRLQNWPNLRITEDSLPLYFNDRCNIGVILGAASGALTDLDLDCAEAIEFALKFPLATDAIFGRKSKPHSHRLYYVKGAAPMMKFVDPISGDTLLELRGDGGFQTVFPGSIHPSGEAIEWETDGPPAMVDAASLCAYAKCLAMLVKLVHNGPRQDNHVGSLTAQDALSDVRYKAVTDVKFVSGCLLKTWSNFVQCRHQCD
jgi:hypothetical protein